MSHSWALKRSLLCWYWNKGLGQHPTPHPPARTGYWTWKIREMVGSGAKLPEVSVSQAFKKYEYINMYT